MKMRKQNHRRGFTLVELSIVLVIIGLIIGGVLTGQQIIQNARLTNTLNSIQAYTAQFQTYVQNYGALPGDDPSAASRFQNTQGIAVTNGSGKGTIVGNFDSNTAADESVLVWNDLRAAGLVKNQPGGTGQPPNAFNGIFGFQNGAFSSLTSTVLCLNNVPGSAASAIDTRLDDGTGNTGNIQSMEMGAGGAAGAATTSYDSSKTYTMCVKM